VRIAIGSDHAGFELKSRLAAHLASRGATVVDCGTHDEEASVDYPDYAADVCGRVTGGAVDLGVLVCGTGIGMSIAANKLAGIRCAVVHDEYTGRVAREHNHANVLALGGRLLASHAAVRIVDAWLDAAPEARHQRRLDKIAGLE
jgi:ribose 5-phosphate isomerase B